MSSVCDDRARNAILRFHESRGEIPAGTYSQGSIGYMRSNSEWATWTADGGIIMSADESLAAGILDLISAYKERDNSELLPLLQSRVPEKYSGAKGDYYAVLYYVPQDYKRPDLPYELAELRPEDVYVNGPKLQHELIIGLKDSERILSHSSILRLFDEDGCAYYSVGVRTHPDHRRKGLGTAVVSAMLDKIKDMHGVAVWECRVDNAASLAMARSLEFHDCIWTFNWFIQPA